MCAKLLNIRKYPLLLVDIPYYSPVFFDMVPNNYFCKERLKIGYCQNFCLRKKTLDSCFNHSHLWITLQLMIIFPGKTDRSIKDLPVPDNLCIVTQKKSLDG